MSLHSSDMDGKNQPITVSSDDGKVEEGQTYDAIDKNSERSYGKKRNELRSKTELFAN